MPLKERKAKKPVVAAEVAATAAKEEAAAPAPKKGKKRARSDAVAAEPQQQPSQQAGEAPVAPAADSQPQEAPAAADEKENGVPLLANRFFHGCPGQANPILTPTTLLWAEAAAKALTQISAKGLSQRPQLFSESQSVELVVHHTVGPLFKRKWNDCYIFLPHPMHDRFSGTGLVITSNESMQRQTEELNVPGVTKVLNYRTFHDQFNTQQLLEALVQAHDVFMADRWVLPRLTVGPVVRLLRDVFPVDLHPLRLEQNVAEAYRLTRTRINAFVPLARTRVGHTDMSAEQLADNVMAVLEQLSSYLPNGWSGIRSAVLKFDNIDDVQIPIYHRPVDVDTEAMKKLIECNDQTVRARRAGRHKTRQARKLKNKKLREEEDKLELVRQRWAAFRKNPHLFGELPPEAPKAEPSADTAADAAAPDAEAAAAPEPAQKRRRKK